MSGLGGSVADPAVTVTALLPDRAAAESVVAALLRTGLPRDRVEVAVTPAVASREFGDVRPRARHRSLVSAAVGGFIGLLLGSLAALVIVWLPGFHDAGVLAFAQLLGPNLTTLTGAVVGAGFGYFRRREPPPAHARLEEAPDRILVTVSARSREEAERLAGLLERAGGDGRIENGR